MSAHVESVERYDVGWPGTTVVVKVDDALSWRFTVSDKGEWRVRSIETHEHGISELPVAGGVRADTGKENAG